MQTSITFIDAVKNASEKETEYYSKNLQTKVTLFVDSNICPKPVVGKFKAG